MSNNKVDSDKLEELKDYFLKGGSTETEDVLAFIGTEDEEVMGAYIKALKETYPDQFGGKKKAKAAPMPEPEPEPEPRYFIKDRITGLVQELEVSATKSGKTTFNVKEPKDLVKIILKGEVTEVDLLLLKRLPQGSEFMGESVAKLIQLAELAKA
jgi:hypothetical protein